VGMKVIGESLICKSAEGISNFVFSFKNEGPTFFRVVALNSL
jgi:hypothetical protein